MAVSVNPPPQLRIPKKFFDDKESRSYFEQNNIILFQMWQRMGGNTDLVADSQNLVMGYSFSEQEPVKNFRSVSVSSSYTMLSYDFVNAISGADITFPKYPQENDVIIIRNGDGSTIKLNGSGKKMNGKLTGSLRKEGTAIEFHYFIDTDEWFAR